MRSEPKNTVPGTSTASANPGPASKAEKVRSSRYEWEGKSNESDRSAGSSNAARKSLLGAAFTALKKFFSGNRGPGRRSFFDNDDDATPSAA